MELNAESRAELEAKANFISAKNVDILRDFASRARGAKPRRLIFHFLKSPAKLTGAGRLQEVVMVRNRLEGAPFEQVARETGQTEILACGLLFRSIGYSGVPVPGVAFDAKRGVIPTRDGRVVDAAGTSIPGLYAAGWIKRGPSGIIGTNRADSVASVKSLLADLPVLPQDSRMGSKGVAPLLEARAVRPVSFADWVAIDAQEVARGRPRGKPREKFTRVEEMLACFERARQSVP
jgi:ferredoxin--NADP+ reductase